MSFPLETLGYTDTRTIAIIAQKININLKLGNK